MQWLKPTPKFSSEFNIWAFATTGLRFHLQAVEWNTPWEFPLRCVLDRCSLCTDPSPSPRWTPEPSPATRPHSCRVRPSGAKACWPETKESQDLTHQLQTHSNWNHWFTSNVQSACTRLTKCVYFRWHRLSVLNKNIDSKCWCSSDRLFVTWTRSAGLLLQMKLPLTSHMRKTLGSPLPGTNARHCWLKLEPRDDVTRQFIITVAALAPSYGLPCVCADVCRKHYRKNQRREMNFWIFAV